MSDKSEVSQFCEKHELLMRIQQLEEQLKDSVPRVEVEAALVDIEIYVKSDKQRKDIIERLQQILDGDNNE